MQSKIYLKRKLQKPSAVLFDWDGTIIHGQEAIMYAMREVCEVCTQHGISVPQYEGCSRSIRDIFNHVPHHHISMIYKTFDQAFSSYGTHNTELCPGIIHALKSFKALEIPLGIVSNKNANSLRSEAKKFELDQYFESIIGSGDAKFDKPHPAPLELAIQDMQIENKVWMIGDTINDIECAKQHGSISILYGDRSEDEIKDLEPDIFVRTHIDLVEIIHKLA